MVNLNGIMRGQAAMEYLMTYGWALLVIVIVIAILLIINPFSAPQGCRFDDLAFSCTNPVVDSSGNLFMRITNGKSDNIVVRGLDCTDDKSPTPPSTLDTAGNLGTLQRQGYFETGSLGLNCNKQGRQLSAGGEFSGKIWMAYSTEDEYANSYPAHITSGSFVTKVGQ